MATATKIQLVEFNKDEALNGASLAFSSNGQLSGAVSDYVLSEWYCKRPKEDTQ